ncbi:hypothetical protein [Rhizobium sp. RHZ01]|uniref:hypothetical protein n=1 Tax=Rhizobium sp. RHZ01 TaxID=2769304 RepID=UPI0017803E7B|nr:hypothetical protein [Rhizobium sp. RHZ01]MBD9447313.1 hypothetical protein [Rhizobium sp. RHZ01]
MTKTDYPPLHMVLDHGRLVSSSAYEQERLDSYPNGTPFTVKITSERGGRTMRRWWLVLGLAVRQCQTPWKTAEQASQAIKLATGYVKVKKSPTGEMVEYPKSLSELDEPELERAFEAMVSVLSRITGVDVLTLTKEASADEAKGP